MLGKRIVLLGIISSLLFNLFSAVPLLAQDIPLPPNLAVITPENASQLVEVARIGNGQVLDVTWSPDKKVLVISSTAGVWFMNSLVLPPRLLAGHFGVARHAVFSSDGVMLGAGDEKGNVFIWNGMTGELIKQFSTQLVEINRIAFDPSRSRIAAADDAGSAQVLDIQTGETLFSIQSERQRGILDTLIFSSDGRYLSWMVKYVGGDVDFPGDIGGAWQLLDLERGTLLPVPSWHDQQYDGNFTSSMILFTAAGDPLILTGSILDGVLTLQDFFTGELVEESETLIRQALEPEEEDFELSFDYGAEVQFYLQDDSYRRNSYAVLPYWTPWITHVITAPASFEDQSVLIGYWDGTLEIWQNTSGTRVDLQLRTHEPLLIQAHTLDLNGPYTTALINAWRSINEDQREAFYTALLEVHDGAATGLVFIRDANWGVRGLVSSGEDGTLRYWAYPLSIENNQILYQGEESIGNLHYDMVNNVLLFNHNRYDCQELCSHIMAYDLNTHESGVAYDLGERRRSEGLLFSHDGSQFALIDQFRSTRSLTLWKTEPFGMIRDLSDPYSVSEDMHPSEFSMEFSPDDRLFAVGYGECQSIGCNPGRYYGYVRLWDTATLQELVVLEGHAGQVFDIAFTPDGKLLITGSADGTVRFWGVPTQPSIAPQ